MIEAKCYGVFGFWRYYRTPDGRTFSARDNKVFYHGNVKKKKKKSTLENEVFRIMEKSLKAALDAALDDIFKDWK